MIITQGTHIYLAEPVPEFDRSRVLDWATCYEPGRLWLEVRMDDGAVITIQHQPPAVDIHRIDQEIREALE
jgi:hypothetical protein